MLAESSELLRSYNSVVILIKPLISRMLRNIYYRQNTVTRLFRPFIPWLNTTHNNNNNNNTNNTKGNNGNNKDMNGTSQVHRCGFHTSVSLNESHYFVEKHFPRKKHGRRDLKVRQLFCDHEDERNALRCLRKSDILPHAVKAKASEDLAALPRDSCITRVRDRCVLTDRARSTVRKYKISRIEFRNYADDGLIPGYTRSTY